MTEPTISWRPGSLLSNALDSRIGQSLPGGYTLRKKEGLIVPYYIDNSSGIKESLGREAGYALPLAAVGFVAGGFLGVAIGHVLGASLGYIRETRIRGSAPGWSPGGL